MRESKTKSLTVWIAVSAALSVAACSAAPAPSRMRASGGMTEPMSYASDPVYDDSNDDMASAERYRAWWTEAAKDGAFERRAALEEHRSFCARYPADASCDSWFHP